MNNDLIISILERRSRLGWSQNSLAEKAGVPSSALRRIENGKGYWEDYIKAIDSTLNRAIASLPHIDTKRNLDLPTLFVVNNNIEKMQVVKRKKRLKWAIKYNECIECGTTDVVHVARGLCSNCYNRNIESRHKDKNRVRKYGVSRTTLTAEYLFDNYIQKHKSLSEIARESNCTRQYVYKRMRLLNIPLRDRSSARTMALDKGKLRFIRKEDGEEDRSIILHKIRYQEDFFSAWSPEMAYVLGVIYTDGYLHYGITSNRQTTPVGRLIISQKEPELLEKVLALMKCNARIFFTKRRQYGNIVAGELYHFQIASDKIYEALWKFGLKPNKSLSLKFPYMPGEYIRHFIRGCWDGDGSVYVEKRNKRIKASYVSGSKEFIEVMVDVLRKEGFLIKTIHVNKGKNPSYYYRLTVNQTSNFYHYLYDDVPESQYLMRKYNLFKLSSARL